MRHITHFSYNTIPIRLLRSWVTVVSRNGERGKWKLIFQGWNNALIQDRNSFKRKAVETEKKWRLSATEIKIAILFSVEYRTETRLLGTFIPVARTFQKLTSYESVIATHHCSIQFCRALLNIPRHLYINSAPIPQLAQWILGCCLAVREVLGNFKKSAEERYECSIQRYQLVPWRSRKILLIKYLIWGENGIGKWVNECGGLGRVRQRVWKWATCLACTCQILSLCSST